MVWTTYYSRPVTPNALTEPRGGARARPGCSMAARPCHQRSASLSWTRSCTGAPADRSDTQPWTVRPTSTATATAICFSTTPISSSASAAKNSVAGAYGCSGALRIFRRRSRWRRQRIACCCQTRASQGCSATRGIRVTGTATVAATSSSGTTTPATWSCTSTPDGSTSSTTDRRCGRPRGSRAPPPPSVRLTILTHYYPPEVGAPQARLANLAARLAERGVDVTVHTGPPHYPDGRIRPPYRNRIWLDERDRPVRVVRSAVYPAPNRGFTPRLANHLSLALTAVGTARRAG